MRGVEHDDVERSLLWRHLNGWVGWRRNRGARLLRCCRRCRRGLSRRLRVRNEKRSTREQCCRRRKKNNSSQKAAVRDKHNSENSKFTWDVAFREPPHAAKKGRPRPSGHGYSHGRRSLALRPPFAAIRFQLFALFRREHVKRLLPGCAMTLFYFGLLLRVRER